MSTDANPPPAGPFAQCEKKLASFSTIDIFKKFGEIVAIVKTLQLLLKQLNGMCIQGLFRFFFGIIFYFTPQINPFVWVDRYEDYVKQVETENQALLAAQSAGINAGPSAGGCSLPKFPPPMDNADNAATDCFKKYMPGSGKNTDAGISGCKLPKIPGLGGKYTDAGISDCKLPKIPGLGGKDIDASIRDCKLPKIPGLGGKYTDAGISDCKLPKIPGLGGKDIDAGIRDCKLPKIPGLGGKYTDAGISGCKLPKIPGLGGKDVEAGPSGDCFLKKYLPGGGKVEAAAAAPGCLSKLNPSTIAACVRGGSKIEGPHVDEAEVPAEPEAPEEQEAIVVVATGAEVGPSASPATADEE